MENETFTGRIKFYLNWGFKIALFLFGVVSLFGYFDLTGKIIGAFMLFLLWLHFDPVGLALGNSKKWINYFIIAIFYIFVLDTFTQVIQTTNIQSPEFQNGYVPIDNFLSKTFGNGYQAIRQYIIGIHYGEISLSEFSSTFGFSALLLISLYITFSLELEKDSLAYPIVVLLRRKEEFWSRIISNKFTLYSPLKFLLTLFCLIIFSHYFFNLVNQWMLVTIGNSTFIIAFFLVAKDIKNTGITILDKIGNFDEELIYFVRKIFHDPKKFILGFSILLGFHYLSDVNLFFIPYTIPTVDIDEYYLRLVGEANHLPIASLFAKESAATVWHLIANFAVYIFSVFGAFSIFLIPVAFIFMGIAGKNVKDYLERKHNRILLYFMMISITVFILSPWISMRGLFQDASGNILGIYGVDLNTRTISEAGIQPVYLFALIILLAAISIKFAEKHWMQEYSITLIFLYSLTYLGLYIWHFFTSAAYYYSALIQFVFSPLNITLLVLFSALLIIEALFYLGGFVYLGYILSRYIITQKTRYIVTSNSMIIWTVALIGIPAFFLYRETPDATTIASIIIASFFLFSYALYKEFTGVEYKDDYILSVNQVIAAFQILVIAEIFERGFLGESLLLVIGGVLLLLLSLISLRFFKIYLPIKDINPKGFIHIIIFGMAFGILFYFIPDPFVAQSKADFGMVLFYLAMAAIAEEVLFRGIIMNISEKAFSYRMAVFLQSLVFALIHFVALSSIINYYILSGFTAMLLFFYILIYAILLFSFGMFAAFIYHNKNRNIIYPIIFHFTANLLPLVIFRFF